MLLCAADFEFLSKNRRTGNGGVGGGGIFTRVTPFLLFVPKFCSRIFLMQFDTLISNIASVFPKFEENLT